MAGILSRSLRAGSRKNNMKRVATTCKSARQPDAVSCPAGLTNPRAVNSKTPLPCSPESLEWSKTLMNHTYKTLYNTALGAWVAVPEIARNRGKAPHWLPPCCSSADRHGPPFLRVRQPRQRILPLAPALLPTRKFPGAMAARQSVPMPKPLRGMTWPLATVRVPKVAAGPVAAETESG